ncbi:MAG: hypothetical protein IAF38_19825 [Bacteroidia bacterium]|nr:hypothetical protein [Bacteroidia bacterium]
MSLSNPEKKYFNLLKEEIAETFRSTFPEAPEKIEEWTGKYIEAFQAELQRAVKSSVSSKWFYTHIKSDSQEKLPRLDVLNLLSQYAGYLSWDDFVLKKKIDEPPVQSALIEFEVKESNATEHEKHEIEESHLREKREVVKVPYVPVRKKSYALQLAACGLLVIFMISWIVMRKEEKVRYSFCFTDANFGGPLKTGKIEIYLLNEMESPQVFKCDSNACIRLEHKPGKVKFIVKADYCFPDTISRIFEKDPANGNSESIALRTDDYALMISIFSNSNLDDWEKRKEQLNKMFADEAEIFQLDPEDQRGMEIYNKAEFINKMTMPSKSLKDIVVLETAYRNKKIISLRFTQKNKP